MSDIGLGKIIETEQFRDAIHIAVAPVTATCKLAPGQDIGFVEAGDNTKVGLSDKPIGIVDPFLKALVFPGQRFWMFLYPNTITSLRHEWVHPAFGAIGEVKAERNVEASKKWIEEFAERIDKTYRQLMDAAETWANYSDWTMDNSETYKEHYDEFEEFWEHYEIVTGTTVHDKSVPYSCSC